MHRVYNVNPCAHDSRVYINNYLTHLFLQTHPSLSNSGNATYPSVQSLLYSHLLSKNMRTEIQRNVILPVVLYGCKTWSLTLMEKHRPSVSENTVLREYLDLRQSK
jgi:hypothetical protein